MGKKWTTEQKKAASEKAKLKYQETLNKPNVETVPMTDVTPTSQPAAAPQLITLTKEQFDQLIGGLTNGNSDKAPAPNLSTNNEMSLGQQRTNAQGQVVGSFIKFPIEEGYYPNPIEEITEFMDKSKKTKRFGFSDNYYLTWDWDSKPYDTKYGTSMREPTFHATLYANQYDEEGNETDKYIVIQTLHFNEDESTALTIAAEMGYEANHDNMRQVMNDARLERVKRWLLGVFFPENNFGLNETSFEEAIGGSVVRVVTKSNVQGFGNKTPKIDFDELQ